MNSDEDYLPCQQCDDGVYEICTDMPALTSIVCKERVAESTILRCSVCGSLFAQPVKQKHNCNCKNA